MLDAVYDGIHLLGADRALIACLDDAAEQLSGVEQLAAAVLLYDKERLGFYRFKCGEAVRAAEAFSASANLLPYCLDIRKSGISYSVFLLYRVEAGCVFSTNLILT